MLVDVHANTNLPSVKSPERMGNLDDEGLDLKKLARFPFGEPCSEFSLEPCLE